MEKKEMLYEGKAKKVYKTDDENLYIVDYKDDATAFNGKKKGQITGKGIINNKMSNFLMKKMAEEGIPTHFVEEISDRETVVKKVTIVPLEVIIRNVAAGSFSKRFGVEEGKALLNPTLEYCLKDDALDDPMINDYQITAIGAATKEDLDVISDLTFKINEFLKKYFASIKIILADEISPDTCRLWDAETHAKLDKDRFRRDLGDVEEAYIEVAKRMGLI